MRQGRRNSCHAQARHPRKHPRSTRQTLDAKTCLTPITDAHPVGSADRLLPLRERRGAQASLMEYQGLSGGLAKLFRSIPNFFLENQAFYLGKERPSAWRAMTWFGA